MLSDENCSFCGQGKGEVEILLIAGPGVCICDKCVELCVTAIQCADNPREPDA